MNRIELKCFSTEVKRADRKAIKTGIAVDRDTDPESVAIFGTQEEALKELQNEKYKPSCRYYSGPAGGFYIVKEYVVECSEVNEGGEPLEILGFDTGREFYFDDNTNFERGGIVLI